MACSEMGAVSHHSWRWGRYRIAGLARRASARMFTSAASGLTDAGSASSSGRPMAWHGNCSRAYSTAEARWPWPMPSSPQTSIRAWHVNVAARAWLEGAAGAGAAPCRAAAAGGNTLRVAARSLPRAGSRHGRRNSGTGRECTTEPRCEAGVIRSCAALKSHLAILISAGSISRRSSRW